MIHSVILLVAVVAQSDGKAVDTPGPSQQYEALARRYEEAFQDFKRACLEARTEEDDRAASDHLGRKPQSFANDFMSLARTYPGSAAAEDALVWVASHVCYGSETEEAKRVLTRDHIASVKLGKVFAFQWNGPGSRATEELLRRAYTESPNREIRGLAGYWLGRFLKEQADWSRYERQNRDRPPDEPSVVEEGWGLDYRQRLRALDPELLDAEAERLFAHVADVYGDVAISGKGTRHKNLAAEAGGFLRRYRELAVGRTAPEIEGEDLDGVRFRLSDYRGRVVVLDFCSHFNCGLCQEFYPHERSLVERWKGQPFAVLGINADRDRAELKAAMKEDGNTWRCWWDHGWDGPIQAAWNVRSYPTIYVIDADGIIRFQCEHLPGQALDDAVDRLMEEMKEKAKPEGKRLDR